jgi:6-phosphogluconolactonase
MARVTVAADAAALAASAADRIATLLSDALAHQPEARVCLTGGRTARTLYQQLARACAPGAIDLQRVRFFWGDERHVPPDHADSNFGMAAEALLRPCGVPEDRVHRMRGELEDAAAAAADYAALLRRHLRRGEPLFDVMLLGLGEDAHIASIFPGSPLLTGTAAAAATDADDPGDAGERSPLAAAVWASHLNAWRITLTPKAVLNASSIVIVTDGAAKAAAVDAALHAPDDRSRVPAQLLRSAGERVEWWLDREAAARLPRQ